MPELSRIRRSRSRSERFLVRTDIVAATFVIAALAHTEPAAALVGADLADLSLQRYTVSVASAKGKCTGVVLAQDIVLTAAHCTRDAKNLVVGGNRGSGSPTDPPVPLSPVIRAIESPAYNEKLPGSTDLAMLKLAKPLPDRFSPAFFGGPVPRNDDDLIAVGYGKSAAIDPKAGTILRMVLLRVSEKFPTYYTLVRSGEETAEAGAGDSGGPVFTYRGMTALVAIMVGYSSHRTVAIPIAPNFVWINETMEKLGGR
jgi:Trypsin